MSYHGAHNADLRNRQNILQDLQQKQQLLQHGNAAAGNIPTTQHMLNRAAIKHETIRMDNPLLALTTRRNALEYASAHSSGYFVASDSTYGNPILPVIPRINDDS